MFAKQYERKIPPPAGREKMIVEQVFALRLKAAKTGYGIQKVYLTGEEIEAAKKELKVLKNVKAHLARPSPFADLEAYFGCQVEAIEALMEMDGKTNFDVNEKVA